MSEARPDDSEPVWRQARSAFAAGRSARQIAHATGLLPSRISARAATENWPAPPPPDWLAIRQDWENGQSAAALAKAHGVSVHTLHKRARRAHWQRQSANGLSALRQAVTALEQALGRCDMADPASTARLAAALSMAAGRLSSAERKRAQQAAGAPDPDDEAAPAQAEIARTRISTLFARLTGHETLDPPE